MDFLVEFGTEEIPASIIPSIEKQLRRDIIPHLLENFNIIYDQIDIFITPRRIVIIIYEIDVHNKEKYIKGLEASKGLDDEGKFTHVTKLFIKQHNVSAKKVSVVKFGDKKYICIEKNLRTILEEKLPRLCHEILKRISLPQYMRWDETDVKFIRPIRWITTVLNTNALQFAISDEVIASTLSYGPRFTGTPKIKIKMPSLYKDTMKQFHVIVSSEEREASIIEQIKDIEEKYKVDVIENSELIAETANLVEFPTVVTELFDKKYLSLPSPIIHEVLYHHVKTFACKNSNRFVAVVNQLPENAESIAKGYIRVINARLDDALFYYKKDTTQSIGYFLKRANKQILHEKIGTYGDLAKKEIKTFEKFAKMLGLSSKQTQNGTNTLKIAKFIWGTHIIGEFPDIADKYVKIIALHYNVEKDVADTLPYTITYQQTDNKLYSLINLSVNATLLAEYVKAGVRVKKNFDPFGLRRLAYKILNTILDVDLNLSLNDLVDTLVESNKHKKYLHELIIGRLEVLWQNQDISHELIEVGKSLSINNSIYKINTALKQFNTQIKDNPTWYVNLQAMRKRINNILKKVPEKLLSAKVSKYTTKPNQELHNKIQSIKNKAEKYFKDVELIKYYKEVAKLYNDIEKYFENVMVLDKDKNKLKENVSLLKQVHDMIEM